MNEIAGQNLFEQIQKLIEQTKQNVAVAINSSFTLMYWNIGKLINDEILQNKRAEYGKEIVVTLSRQLQDNFGKGFSEKNLRSIRAFYLTFPIWQTVSSKLSWSHYYGKKQWN